MNRRDIIRTLALAPVAIAPVAAVANPQFDEWDHLVASLKDKHPNIVKTVKGARQNNMRLEWMYSMVLSDSNAHPILLFQNPEGQMFSIGPEWCWQKV